MTNQASPGRQWTTCMSAVGRIVREDCWGGSRGGGVGQTMERRILWRVHNIDFVVSEN